MKYAIDYINNSSNDEKNKIIWKTFFNEYECIEKLMINEPPCYDINFHGVSVIKILFNQLTKQYYDFKNFFNFISSPNYFKERFKYSVEDELYNLLLKENYTSWYIHEIINLYLFEYDDLIADIEKKQYQILKALKKYSISFCEIIKKENEKELKNFSTFYRFLSEDFDFFKTIKIKSLEHYNLHLGYDYSKIEETRLKSSLSVGGYCEFLRHIFINIQPYKNKTKEYQKRIAKKIFYHEAAHAIAYLKYDEKIIKNQKQQKDAYINQNFLKACRLNNFLYKKVPQKLKNKHISYYCKPAILQNKNKRTLNSKFINDIFNVNLDEQNTYLKSISYSGYNYSRSMEEGWAESLGIILYLLRNPFCEYEQYILKAKKSFERDIIKTLYYSLDFILKNFHFELLNINKNTLRKKLYQIRQFIDHVHNMPHYLSDGMNKIPRKNKSLKIVYLIKKQGKSNIKKSINNIVNK